MTQTDTIVALATPPGVGAIAIIRLSGPEAIGIADYLFRGKALAKQASHTAHFGRFEDENGKTIDEVLVTVFKNPHSYTGEDTVEVSCHGSVYIQQQLVQACLRAGARLAEPGEFTLRAFLNGKMDLSQAEAVADLIASQSAAAHQVALRQLRGGVRNDIQRLRDDLIHFASLVELELDFSEEDVEFADRPKLKALVQETRSHIRALLQSFALGNALKTGVTTVIAGRPNAGKSTLLNALLNEERAIVSEIAGTTRDTIEEVLNIKGVAFRLIDTAGIRAAQDAIEAIGVQRTLEKIAEASILVYVWDVAGGMTLKDVHDDLRNLHKEGLTTLVVCNKMDRNPYFQTEWLVNPTASDIHPYLIADDTTTTDVKPDDDMDQDTDNPSRSKDSSLIINPSSFTINPSSLIAVSAKNAMNIEYLKEKLLETVSGGSVDFDNTIVTNARHYDALRRADASLADVLVGLDTGLTGDFIAQDIRHALNHLGEITGQIGVEDLLSNIFGRFCIGK
jgi:tRNA modification GTPase